MILNLLSDTISKIKLFFILFLLIITINAKGMNFSQLRSNILLKGQENLTEDDRINLNIYSEFLLKDNFNDNINTLNLCKNPLNIEFWMLYLMESDEFAHYGGLLKKVFDNIEQHTANPIVKIDAIYLKSIVEKLNINDFSPEKYGYITKFYVSGPVIDKGILDFENSLPIEKNVNIKKKYKTFYGPQCPYKVNVNANGWLDLNSLYSDDIYGVSVYLASLNIKKEGDYYINFVTNVESKLFIDRKMLYSIREDEYDKQLKNIFKVHLSKGSHLIWVKAKNDSSIDGYLLENSSRGFMVQMFDNNMNPYSFVEGNYKQGKITNIKRIDIVKSFKDAQVDKKKFKLANILMSYGAKLNAFNILSTILKEDPNPLNNFFMGYICSRFPNLGYRDFTFSYYFKSIRSDDTNYLGKLFIGEYFLREDKIELAKKYILQLYKKFPNKKYILFDMYKLRKSQNLLRSAKKYMDYLLTKVPIDNFFYTLYTEYKSTYHIDRFDYIKRVYESGIKDESILMIIAQHYLNRKKYDDFYKLMYSIKNPLLKTNIALLASTTPYFERDKKYVQFLMSISNTYKQNSTLFSTLAGIYLDNKEYNNYENIQNFILSYFGNMDNNKEYELFSFPNVENIKNQKYKNDVPIIILNSYIRVTFFNDLSSRTFKHFLIYVANQNGVAQLTQLSANGYTYFIRVKNSNGREYYFHSEGLKGLEVGSIVELAFVSYNARQYAKLNYMSYYPIIFMRTYPIKRIKVVVDLPKNKKFFVKVKRGYDKLKYIKRDIKPLNAQYKTFQVTMNNIPYFKPELGLPMPYAFLTALILEVPITPKTYLINYYNEIFTDKYLSDNVKRYFDNIKGKTKRDKMLNLYSILQTNFIDDNSRGSGSLWKILSTEKGNYIDKMRVFKAALDYWHVPNKFVIYSNYANVKLEKFNTNQITSIGILTDYDDKPVLSNFTQQFMPYGGDKRYLRVAYMTKNGYDFDEVKNYLVGIESGLDVHTIWNLDTGEITLNIKFIGSYATYKSYFLDKSIQEKVVSRFLANLYPYIQIKDYEVNLNEDIKPFNIIVKGNYSRKKMGNFVLPLNYSKLKSNFGNKEDRKYPFYMMDFYTIKEKCKVITKNNYFILKKKNVKNRAFSYEFYGKKIKDGYIFNKALTIYNGFYSPKTFRKIFKKAQLLDNLEKSLFVLEKRGKK